MATRALLDSNVFLFGFERRSSNSHRILELLTGGEVRGAVTDRIVREVLRYLRRRYGKDIAGKFRDFMLLTCDLVLEDDVPVRREHVGRVGAKDARALAVVRTLELPRLVSTASDFSGAPEWRTPRGFLREIGKRAAPGEE